MTEYSENLSIINSQNGRRSYHFVTPLMEGYSQAAEPYREFRRGVKITTYKDDSLSAVDAVLTANYAIYYEKRRLWEAKGDVVVEKSDGKQLFTQQLFWNERTGKIYSNVDSKIVQSGGSDVFIGEGFESDEEFKDWRFRRMKGRMEVDTAPGDSADSAGSPGRARAPQPAAQAPTSVAQGSSDASRTPAASVQSGAPQSAAPAGKMPVGPADKRPVESIDRGPVEVSPAGRRPRHPAGPVPGLPDGSPSELRDRPDGSDIQRSGSLVFEPPEQ